jgi:putative PIN family toxin of toxin-antitoxin system
MRVVLDANLYVSALLKPGSNPDKILKLVKEGEVQLIISQEILL